MKELLREWQEFQRQVLVEEVSSSYDWVGMQYGDVAKQLRAAGVKSLKGKWWKQFKSNHPVRIKYRQWWKNRKNPMDNIGIPMPKGQRGLTPMQTRRAQLKKYTPAQLKKNPNLAIRPTGIFGVELPSSEKRPAKRTGGTVGGAMWSELTPPSAASEKQKKYLQNLKEKAVKNRSRYTKCCGIDPEPKQDILVSMKDGAYFGLSSEEMRQVYSSIKKTK